MSVKKLNCVHCDKPGDELTLAKCPECYKMVCHDCASNMSGRLFCSSNCGRHFFFGEEEDQYGDESDIQESDLDE